LGGAGTPEENQPMASLFDRAWSSSPASLTRAVQRRVRKLRAAETWHQLAAGPAKGANMLLPVPLEPWGHEMIHGQYDAFLYDAITRRRPLAGARCWDIGANMGYHSLALAAQGAQVLAFEPGSANADRLRLHLERNPELAKRIRVVTLAVADRDGTMRFVESRDLRGSSSGSHLDEALPPVGDHVYASFERNSVRGVRIDTLIEQQGEAAPDIVKIDVEGAEHLVVQGGRRSLARYKPLLLIEVHHICVMLSLSRLLSELNYQVEVLDAEHATPSRCFIAAW
jgi:FkbM family methyltransferase